MELTLPKKDCLLGLSPMDDITDLPFRQLCKEHGADLLITEFIASEALNRDAEKSLRKMRFTAEQRPLGIQVFGSDEGELLRCLEVVEGAAPDFIDMPRTQGGRQGGRQRYPAGHSQDVAGHRSVGAPQPSAGDGEDAPGLRQRHAHGGRLFLTRE